MMRAKAPAGGPPSPTMPPWAGSGQVNETPSITAPPCGSMTVSPLTTSGPASGSSSPAGASSSGGRSRRSGAAPPGGSAFGGRRQQPLRREVLDDLIVFDLDVEPLLVPVDQLLQRRRQLPIGGDDGDELADVEAAAKGQVAADRVEEERRHLGQKIVQELDHELPLVDAEAQVEELEEAVADLGPLPFVGVVDVDGLHAVDDLADPPGEAAGGELALLSELKELPAHPRDDGELDADHACRHQAEPEILDHDEDEGCRGLRAV